jgi:hypothetical protein
VATPPRTARRSKLGPVIIAVAVLIGLAVAGLFIRTRETTTTPASSAASATAAPVHSAHAAPATSACIAPCCGGFACAARADNARGCLPEGGHCRACPSERACIPGPCEARIAENGVWMLRFASVTSNGKDILPRPKVCMRRAGADNDAWVCHSGGIDKHGPRLRVTTAELTHDGIDLSVTRGDETTAVGTHLHHPAIGIVALCRGLNFRFTSDGVVGYAVTLFLDDADSDG